MTIQIFLRQMIRGKGRTLVNILLLATATAFFVISLNLYRNSASNLRKVDETFRTIAFMELYGDVNRYGELTDPMAADYEGYLSVGASGLDLSPILGADSIDGYDLRSRHGAWIPEETALHWEDFFANPYDLIRFQLIGEEPVVLKIYDTSTNRINTTPATMTITHQVLDEYAYGTDFDLYCRMRADYIERYADSIRAFNGEGADAPYDYLILQPGVEYVVSTTVGEMMWDAALGKYVQQQDPDQPPPDSQLMSFYFDSYGSDYQMMYYSTGEELSLRTIAEDQPFFIHRWEDVQKDPALLTYYSAVAEAYRISHQSYAVTLTNDITSLPAFHTNRADLTAGRLITEEEYASGAKVCMVSSRMAELQGWTVGDTLDMHFYQYDAFRSTENEMSHISPDYRKNNGGFFYQDRYEIVGIYQKRESLGTSEIAPTTIALNWAMIYVPERSVEKPPAAEEPRFHASLLSIWLENGKANDFLNEMEKSGLLTSQPGQYTMKFTIYDQGYSTIQPGLETMFGTSRLMLALSAALLLSTAALVAYFFTQNQRQNIGILRMLGGTQRQALAGVLLCALLIVLFSVTCGAALGHRLTDSVGQNILTHDLTESAEKMAFSTFLLSGQTVTQVETTIEADQTLTVTASIVSVLLIFLLVLFFLLPYIRKEPWDLLPKNSL